MYERPVGSGRDGAKAADGAAPAGSASGRVRPLRGGRPALASRGNRRRLATGASLPRRPTPAGPGRRGTDSIGPVGRL
ncbi:hypothetical protein GCM10010381_04370 [Streptomyces xantholiticus]|nr:hypothetical protein GCM10010381_04370 [Streptomyces xantholiticus]